MRIWVNYMNNLLSESEGLTVSRLLRYAAAQRCTDARQWDDARQALADCPQDEDTAIAWNELEQKQAACGCTSCTARRVLKTGITIG